MDVEQLIRRAARKRAAHLPAALEPCDLEQVARIALHLWAHKAPVDPLHRLKWTCDVIRTAMVEELRRIGGRPGTARYATHVYHLDEHLEMFETPGGDDPAGALVCKQALKTLDDLSDKHRFTFEALLAGATATGISDVLGVTPSRVSQIATEVRSKLESALA